MYTYKKKSDLTAIDYDIYRNYKLCMVEYYNYETDEDRYIDKGFFTLNDKEQECGQYLYLYFTSLDLKKQWGDDWDDVPYEFNAGHPYDHDENQNEIEILVIMVPKDGVSNPELPNDMFYGPGGTCISMAQVNSKCCAWIYIFGSDKKCDGISILAGDNPSEVIRKLKIGNVIL